MSTTGHPQDADTPADPAAIAGTLREATFANLLTRADGPSLAATALLAKACDAIGCPYQVSTVRTRAAAATRRAGMDAETVVIAVGIEPTDIAGAPTIEADARLAATPAPTALEIADRLDTPATAVLALAGIVAAGEAPSAHPTVLDRAGLDRRPGVSVPTADPVDGIAHSTLAHGPFSGQPTVAAETVGELDDVEDLTEVDHRRLASLVAIAVTGAEAATVRAATAVEGLLRPYPIEGPVATLGGYADVLEATAATAPGIGIALPLDATVRSAALEHWREHARRAHSAVRAASTARYDGLVIARLHPEELDIEPPIPIETVARLLRDFRAPEPAVLVVADDRAALATTDTPAAATLPAAAAAAGGSALTRKERGVATFDPDRTEALITTLREAL